MRIFKTVAGVAVFCLFISGCQTLLDKFKRKPGKEEIKVVVDTHEYTSQYSPQQRYANSFALWQAWHSELLNSLTLDGNRKKQVQAANLALKNLRSVKDLLISPKAEKLEVYIKDLEEIAKGLASGRISSNRQRRLSGRAEKVRRAIRREFYLKRVEKYIKVDDSQQ